MEKVLDRLSFMFSKMWGAFRWMAVSGVVTYALVELLKFVDQLQLAQNMTTLIYMLVNITLFAVAKFVEGEDK